MSGIWEKEIAKIDLRIAKLEKDVKKIDKQLEQTHRRNMIYDRMLNDENNKVSDRGN